MHSGWLGGAGSPGWAGWAGFADRQDRAGRASGSHVSERLCFTMVSCCNFSVFEK